MLVTGHTGFKGSWLVLWLHHLGAKVSGLASGVPTSPSLYELARVSEHVVETLADVRDTDAVTATFADQRPEVVIHMAAQPFVRRSFREPRKTYEVNVMGTVNMLEAARSTPGLRAVVNVTSDKCYENRAGRSGRPFVEEDPKGGHDPYSSSKGCAELVIDAYIRSFFAPESAGPRLASARAGNVIGGGDWGEDRLLHDVMHAALSGEAIAIRNPQAVRPWQHVLNPLSGYLELAQRLVADSRFQGGWNFGPDPADLQTVRWIVEHIVDRWEGPVPWEVAQGSHPDEADFLALDSGKARTRLDWHPVWDLGQALDATVEWYAALRRGAEMRTVTESQIASFETSARRVGAG